MLSVLFKLHLRTNVRRLVRAHDEVERVEKKIREGGDSVENGSGNSADTPKGVPSKTAPGTPREKGIEADTGPKKNYSTDANLAGLSHEAEDLEDLDTSCEIDSPELSSFSFKVAIASSSISS